MPKTQFNTLEDLAREIANGRGRYSEKNTIKSVAQDTPRIAPSETMAAMERPELEMVTLASSSKGNATLVRTPQTQVLVDCGISARRITQALAELHVDPAQLAGVLLTHEHSDHVKGLASFLKRYPLPVYTTRATFQALGETAVTYARRFVEVTRPFTLGDLDVERFAISHDAADPGGFIFAATRVKAAVCTDLGFVSSDVEAALREATLLVLEANHDPVMLREGPYSAFLKARILGARGHLANGETGRLLARLYRGRRMDVILAHRSETNNTCAAVAAAMETMLDATGIKEEKAGIHWQHGAVLGNVRCASKTVTNEEKECETIVNTSLLSPSC